MNVRNKSRKIFFDEARNYQTQTITDSNPEFNILGNFFISEGKPGKVLKVHVKKRMGCDFYRAIELAISQDFPYQVSQPQYIGLGGLFVAYNGNCNNLPYFYNTSIRYTSMKRDWKKYHDVNKPLIAMGTIINEMCFRLSKNKKRIGQNIPSSFDIPDSHNTVEYLGYFYPAKELYHADSSFCRQTATFIS